MIREYDCIDPQKTLISHASVTKSLSHAIRHIHENLENKISLKEQVFDFPPQPVITKDNVSVKVDSVVFSKVFDPQKYTYGVESPIAGLQKLSATTLRSIIGGMELDTTLSSRETINAQMEAILDEATDPWGIKVNRVELKNIDPPREIEEVMTKQMRAERERRQTVLEAQAHQESVVSRAEGDKKAKVLAAEAEREAKIALAQGEAESIRLVYEAQADGLEKLREAHIDESVLRLKGLEALRDVADGRATKIYMPTDITKAVSTLGIISESLGIGDSTPVDKGTDVHIETEIDPCLNEQTSTEGRKAAATGDAIRTDLESRRKGVL
jgi:regulator of protease activity HflC (stomatin/prohibitin superfamily)